MRTCGRRIGHEPKPHGLPRGARGSPCAQAPLGLGCRGEQLGKAHHGAGARGLAANLHGIREHAHEPDAATALGALRVRRAGRLLVGGELEPLAAVGDLDDDAVRVDRHCEQHALGARMIHRVAERLSPCQREVKDLVGREVGAREQLRHAAAHGLETLWVHAHGAMPQRPHRGVERRNGRPGTRATHRDEVDDAGDAQRAIDLVCHVHQGKQPTTIANLAREPEDEAHARAVDEARVLQIEDQAPTAVRQTRLKPLSQHGCGRDVKVALDGNHEYVLSGLHTGILPMPRGFLRAGGALYTPSRPSLAPSRVRWSGTSGSRCSVTSTTCLKCSLMRRSTTSPRACACRMVSVGSTSTCRSS